MYDTVLVPCPKCGQEEGFQTKSGPRMLNNYRLVTAPLEVLVDINRHAPYTCSNCGIDFEVQIQHMAIPVPYRKRGEDNGEETVE